MPSATEFAATTNAQTCDHLWQRFQRATKAPPLMMLYPPLATGVGYVGAPEGAELWANAAASGTLYVHIPFCQTRCAFCPFYAVAGKENDYPDYVDALLTEAEMYSPLVRHMRFSSIYFGGGAPSVLPSDLLAKLIGGLKKHFATEGADITLEAHPSHIDREHVAAMCAAGVTRLSLGVQSFNAAVLEASTRGDTIDRIVPAIEAAVNSPLRDLNIDLMYGLPLQTFEVWQSDLAMAAKLKVPSLTLYNTVYIAPFQARCESREYSVASAEDRLKMYDMAYDYLNVSGYPQRHFGAGAFLHGELNAHRKNVLQGLPTLGLGTWAFSSNGAYSYHNLSPTSDWASTVRSGKLPIRQIVTVPEEEKARKYMVEALLLAYADLAHFKKACGAELAEVFPNELAVLKEHDLARIEDGELRLTRTGGHHLREIRYLFASDRVVNLIESGAAGGL